jgi:hypothetical protein
MQVILWKTEGVEQASNEAKAELNEVWPDFDHDIYTDRKDEILNGTLTVISLYKYPVSKEELERIKQYTTAVVEERKWFRKLLHEPDNQDVWPERYKDALKKRKKASDDIDGKVLSICHKYLEDEEKNKNLEDEEKNKTLTLDDYFATENELIRRVNSNVTKPQSKSSDSSSNDLDNTKEDNKLETSRVKSNIANHSSTPSGSSSSDSDNPENDELASSKNSANTKEKDNQQRNKHVDQKNTGEAEGSKASVVASTSHFKKHSGFYIPLLIAIIAEGSAEFIWSKELASTILAEVNFMGLEVLTARNLLDAIAVTVVVSTSLVKLYQQVCGENSKGDTNSIPK